MKIGQVKVSQNFMANSDCRKALFEIFNPLKIEEDTSTFAKLMLITGTSDLFRDIDVSEKWPLYDFTFRYVGEGKATELIEFGERK